MLRVIVAGSRDFTDKEYAKNILDKAFSKHRPDSIVCGMAKGADTVGYEYAKENKIRIDKYPADWNRLGKSAGYSRNVQMAQNAEALVAFWDGESRGTRHMINIARDTGLKIIVCKYKENKIYKYN